MFEGFGISDLVTFLEWTEESRRGQSDAEYGDPADPPMRQFLGSIAAAHARGEAEGPIVRRTRRP